MSYTAHYVGSGGNDANSGLTWALRKLTLNGAEDTPLTAARHTVYVAPGTYRELLTCDLSGPTAYATGTVSVTKGSKTVTGLSTLWAANAEANDWFQCPVLASGTDGVTDGSSTFVSANGNFQAGHVGLTIRISTKAAAIIATVVDSDTITLADTAGTAVTPSAASGLTYNVGPSSPHKVASVDSDTQITLVDAWDDPTLTTLAYQVWGHIEYIGDYLGTNTDGVGGVVRITGSADDIALTRANCITATSINKRTFSGFLMDGTSSNIISTATACSNWAIYQCYIQSYSTSSIIVFSGTGVNNTVMSCFITGEFRQVQFTHSTTVDNAGGLTQNCILFSSYGSCVDSVRIGGISVKNCLMLGSTGAKITTALTVGQATTVNNCLIHTVGVGFQATAVGEILEDYNNIIGCNTARTNTTIGAHSKVNLTVLETRWFFNAIYANAAGKLITPFDLASDSGLLNVAGLNPPILDMRRQTLQDAQREWGALEYDSTLKAMGGFIKTASGLPLTNIKTINGLA